MVTKVTMKKTTTNYLGNQDGLDIARGNEKAFIIEPPAMTSEQLRAAVQNVKENKTSKGNIHGVKTDDNRILTAKQRMFISLVTQGHSPREAYIKAYDAISQNAATVGAAANRLMKLPKVKRLLELNWDKQEKNILLDQRLTRLHIMEELLKHSQNEDINISARIKSLELMGKAVGMFNDRVETKVEQISADELKNELSMHLELLDKTLKH